MAEKNENYWAYGGVHAILSPRKSQMECIVLSAFALLRTVAVRSFAERVCGFASCANALPSPDDQRSTRVRSVELGTEDRG